MPTEPEHHNRENCYFCAHSDSRALEQHHITPRRFGGSDDAENLVTVCANCHRKLEALYGKRFYDDLDVKKDDSESDDSLNAALVPEHSGSGRIPSLYVVEEIASMCEYGAPIDAVKLEFMSRGMGEETAQKTVEKMKTAGDIYEPQQGIVRSSITVNPDAPVMISEEVEDYV